LTDIEDEAALLLIRLTVTRLVARDASQWVDDDPTSLDLIVEDVAAQWHRQEPGNADPAGLEDFWNQYANRVEWARDGGNQCRPEFCPANPLDFDCDNYFRSVWKARVIDLPRNAHRRRLRRRPRPAQNAVPCRPPPTWPSTRQKSWQRLSAYWTCTC